MWAKHSRAKLSKTQEGLHPFSPSVESWSCVALPLVRRVARVWHVSGVAREWPTSPLCHPTPETHPHLHPHFDALSPCPRPRPRPRPPWPHGHHYPTTNRPRSNDDHNLSTYYPSPPSPLVGLKVVGAPWRRDGVAKVSVRLISPLQRLHCNRTHHFLTLYRNQTTCFDVRLKHVPWCSCSTSYRRRRCGPWEVQSSTGPGGVNRQAVRAVRSSYSDQNQATGCQPARPAHPRMQAGGHHCVVHPWSRSRSTSMPSPKADTSQTLRLGLHPLASRAS